MSITSNYGLTEEIAYRLDAGDFYLPYLKLVGSRGRVEVEERRTEPGRVSLAAEEAAEVLDALHAAAALPDAPLADAARMAYAKLGFGIEPEVAHTPVIYAAVDEAPQRAEALERLSDALLEKRRVRFRYQGMHRDEETQREVAPYGLLCTGRNWYLIGEDRDRGAQREFHLGRMREVTAVGAPGAYAIPAGFRLRDLARRAAWELGDDAPLVATVRFGFPGSIWAERNSVGEWLADEDGGAQLRRFHVRQAGPFLRWLLSLEVDAELLEPAALLDEYHQLIARTLRLYEPAATHAQG